MCLAHCQLSPEHQWHHNVGETRLLPSHEINVMRALATSLLSTKYGKLLQILIGLSWPQAMRMLALLDSPRWFWNKPSGQDGLNYVFRACSM